MRTPIIAGNWKMYKTSGQAKELVNALKAQLGQEERVQVVVCPPFTALAAVGPLLAGTRIALGAQDCSGWMKAPTRARSRRRCCSTWAANTR